MKGRMVGLIGFCIGLVGIVIEINKNGSSKGTVLAVIIGLAGGLLISIWMVKHYKNR